MTGQILTQASHQWATRPDDQRFTSLTELDAFCKSRRAHSRDSVVSSRKLEAIPVSNDASHKGLVIVGPKGTPVNPTHWSFGQLASRGDAPASYLRTLPAPLAADCINFGLKVRRDVEDVKVLLYKNGGDPELSAVTGPGYGRVWNAMITHELVDRFGNGLTGDFKIPGEFGQDVDITKANTTLYASDRDMFVFLADEKRRFEIPNTRVGSKGKRPLARGFFVWNSEVGKTSYGIAMFLFDYVCMNRIVWGVEGFLEIRGRHTVSAPEKWMHDVYPAILAYANAPMRPVEAKLLAAQKAKVDDVLVFLANRKFNKAQVAAIVAVHDAEEGRPMKTLWDVTTGVTAYARQLTHQDTRLEFEREAGSILDLAVA
jgi:hypothetical protein